MSDWTSFRWPDDIEQTMGAAFDRANPPPGPIRRALIRVLRDALKFVERR